MTQEEIIRMAREAGFEVDEGLFPFEAAEDKYIGTERTLERFAALVAAHERNRVMNEPLTKAMWDRFESEIRTDEREACAKVCDDYNDNSCANYADLCAAAIRERSANARSRKEIK